MLTVYTVHALYNYDASFWCIYTGEAIHHFMISCTHVK